MWRNNLFALFLCGLIGSANAKVATPKLLLTGQLVSSKYQKFSVPQVGNSWRYQIQWMFPEGEIAEVGDTVVVFDKTQIDSQVEQLKASLLRVKAQEQSQSVELEKSILQAEFDLKEKKLNVEKAMLDAAIPADYVAAKDYADNQFNLMKAKIELKQAKDKLGTEKTRQQSTLEQLHLDNKKAQLELSNTLNSLENLTLLSEIKGPVSYGHNNWQNKKITVGDTLQVGRNIANIFALDGLKIKAWVNEVDIDKVQLNQKASIYLDTELKKQFSGSVTHISEQANSKKSWGNSKWFEITVEFKDKLAMTLNPGMSVLVSVTPKKMEL